MYSSCIEVIVLGTGTRVRQIAPAVTNYLKKKGLNLEIQDTVREHTAHYH